MAVFDLSFGTDVPVAQAIESGLALASLPSGPRPRAVWEFSSKLRVMALAETLGSLGKSGGQTLAATSTGTAVSVGGSVIVLTGFDSGLLKALTEEAKEFVSRAQPTVKMVVNPNTVRFDQPKRWTPKDTQDGTTFFHFTNSKGQNNHYLTMSFEGNTGNLDARSGERALKRLQAWHNLYALTQEPMVLGPGLENEFSIRFNSKLLPRPVTFRGFYSKVMDFEESAEQPNSVDYSFEFIVTRTEPALDMMVSEIASFLQQQSDDEITPTVDSKLLSGSQGGIIA